MSNGHWCDFCQCNHSSVSCYHPGQALIRDLKADVARLKEENERAWMAGAGSEQESIEYESKMLAAEVKLRAVNKSLTLLKAVKQIDALSTDLYRAGMSDGIKFAIDELETGLKEQNNGNK